LGTELAFVAAIFGLFVVPRLLQRAHIPSAVTSLALGMAAGAWGLFRGDATIHLLATYGISALFLFAGLEVDGAALRRGARPLAANVAVLGGTLVAAALALESAAGLPSRSAWLAALALLTPSTGFILDSLGGFGLDETERFWTRWKAIATEIAALAVLFVVLQSTSPSRLALASAAMVALVLLVPRLMRLFAERIAPWAPRSEFAFLLMMAVVCAFATRKLGAYYLVGAFVVGAAARRFRAELPAMSSERILHATEAFASVFVPFYFFRAGLHLEVEDFGPMPLAAGAAMAALAIPARMGSVALLQRWLVDAPWRSGRRVGLALTPTLVFTLVIAEILRDDFGAPRWLFGGLVVYALATTLLPAALLRAPPPEFEAPHLEEPPAGAGSGAPAA